MATSKNASAARSEVLDLLIEDHKGVKKLFREFEKLSPEADREECEALVSLACAELKLHAQLEEDCFYPAVRAALKEADLLDEAEVEHASAKQLIEQLDAMDAEDPKFAATFKVLSEYVKHHIKEEEGELFPQLARARIDWESLQQQMIERRTELEHELGLADDDAGDEAASGATAAGLAAGTDAQADAVTDSAGGKDGRGKRTRETID